MQTIFNFIFDNFLLVVVVILIWYILVQYKDLKEKTKKINDIFTKTLNAYLEEKINNVKSIAESILKEYENSKEVTADMTRLQAIIEKSLTKNINEKVEASNQINKYKVNTNIDREKYPRLSELEDIGTFNEEDENVIDSSISIARREYNALAFRYNEKAGGFPMTYIIKFLGLAVSYKIFDAPKSSSYQMNYEVFEEEEPEINSLTSLNRAAKENTDLNELMLKRDKPKSNQVDRALVNESDKIINPTLNMKEKETQYNNTYNR